MPRIPGEPRRRSPARHRREPEVTLESEDRPFPEPARECTEVESRLVFAIVRVVGEETLPNQGFYSRAGGECRLFQQEGVPLRWSAAANEKDS